MLFKSWRRKWRFKKELERSGFVLEARRWSNCDCDAVLHAVSKHRVVGKTFDGRIYRRSTIIVGIVCLECGYGVPIFNDTPDHFCEDIKPLRIPIASFIVQYAPTHDEYEQDLQEMVQKEITDLEDRLVILR